MGTGTGIQACIPTYTKLTSFMPQSDQAMFKLLVNCNKCHKICIWGKKTLCIFSNSNTVNFVFLIRFTAQTLEREH